MGDDISLEPGCASCGERYYDIDLKLTSLESLAILQLTEKKKEQYAALQAMNVFALPVPLCVSEMQQQGDGEEEEEPSKEHEIPILYHLHPQFAKRIVSSHSTDTASSNVEEPDIPLGDKASDWTFPICLPCRKSILDKKQLPRFSLANAHDYGNPRLFLISTN